jgi:hypothetical protein
VPTKKGEGRVSVYKLGEDEDNEENYLEGGTWCVLENKAINGDPLWNRMRVTMDAQPDQERIFVFDEGYKMAEIENVEMDPISDIILSVNSRMFQEHVNVYRFRDKKGLEEYEYNLKKFYHFDSHHILYNEDKKNSGTRNAENNPHSHFYNNTIKIDFDYYIIGAQPYEYVVEDDIDQFELSSNNSE